MMNEKEARADITLVEIGQIKAFADLTMWCRLGEITICGFRVVQGEGQEP